MVYKRFMFYKSVPMQFTESNTLYIICNKCIFDFVLIFKYLTIEIIYGTSFINK